MKNISKIVLMLLVAVIMTASFGVTAYALDDESLSVEDMLYDALMDEYRAELTYEAIMDAYGEQAPFSNIIGAEQTHIDALVTLYEAYGLEVPSIGEAGGILLPESVDAALAAGVQAEIDNIAMYDRFLTQELPDDVRSTFEALQGASDSHLSAFEIGGAQDGTGGSENGQKGQSEDWEGKGTFGIDGNGDQSGGTVNGNGGGSANSSSVSGSSDGSGSRYGASASSVPSRQSGGSSQSRGKR